EQSARDKSIRAHAEHLRAALTEPVSEIVAHERADHVHIAVREVDQFQYPVNHRVTERNQRVDCAQRDTVDQLLEERTHTGDSLSSTVGVRAFGARLVHVLIAITGLQSWPALAVLELPEWCLPRSRLRRSRVPSLRTGRRP